jgi:hypothetical protein
MVGNPQGRDKQLVTLKKDDADQILDREYYSQVYKDERFEGSCGAMYYNLEESVEVGMDAHVHIYAGDSS